MIGLFVGVAFPVGAMVVGAIYALWFDPKDERPKGTLRRLT